MCFSGALLLVGTAMSAASTIVQGYAAESQAKAQQQAFDENARIELMLAQDAQHRGEEQITRHALEVRRLLSRQTLSARGVDVASEYFDRIYSDTDLFSRLDAKLILENAAREAWGHQQAASGYQRAAAAAGKQVGYIRTATAIGFGSSILRGVQAAQYAGLLPGGANTVEGSGNLISTQEGVNNIWGVGTGRDWKIGSGVIDDWSWEPYDYAW